MKISKAHARREPRPEASAPPPDPRDEFFSLWAMLGKQRSQMFTITLLSPLGIALTLLISYVRLSHASRFVPFLYVVDRSGEVLALGATRPIAADSDAVVYSSLETFITSVRSVYQDQGAERFILKKAYAFLPADNPRATSTPFLEAYMTANDPRLLSQRFTRSAEIVSILKVPQPKTDRRLATQSSTWRIRWRETTYPVGTTLGEASEWEAFATVRIHPKKTVEAFDPNPLGVYIDHLNWSRLTPETHR
jgi:type IV secretory pathway TrbF-like protein